MTKNQQRRSLTPAQLGSLSAAVGVAALGLRLAHRSPAGPSTQALPQQPGPEAGGCPSPERTTDQAVAQPPPPPPPGGGQEGQTPATFARTYSFTLRYPWFGPVVWTLSALYFFVQITVAWIWQPPYSAVHNTISDLGNTHCGLYGGSYVCSPRHVLMNATFMALGVVMIVGSCLIAQEFRQRESQVERVAASIAFALMAIAGVGVGLVGLFPENTFGAAHATGAAMAIAGGNLCIFILGMSLSLPESFRRTMRVWPIVALTAAVLFACNRNLGLGDGTMERIAQYPESIWLITFGIYISHNHYSRSHAEQASRPYVRERPDSSQPYDPRPT